MVTEDTSDSTDFYRTKKSDQQKFHNFARTTGLRQRRLFFCHFVAGYKKENLYSRRVYTFRLKCIVCLIFNHLNKK